MGAPNDRFEREADRVADRVMRMVEPQRRRTVDLAGEAPKGVQRVCAGCEDEVRGQPIEDENEWLQMNSASSTKPEIGAGMQAQITGLSGGGQPLSASLRSFFEPRFGADFSRVRIHTGSRAAALTRDLQAKAFTSATASCLGSGAISRGRLPGAGC